jgi:hypothetical protein
MGIASSEPKVLADGLNMIVHLVPYPIVARVMTLFEEDDSLYCRDILAREIDVAHYLDREGVPVVKLSMTLIEAYIRLETHGVLCGNIFPTPICLP